MPIKTKSKKVSRATGSRLTAKPTDKSTKGSGRKRVYASSLPVYDSMEQMAAAMQIPLAALKLAKKSGCLFIRHGRCDSGEFIAWWFRQGDKQDEGGVDWASRDKRAAALLKEVKLDEDTGRVIDFNLCANFIRYLTTVGFFGELDRMESEFPATMKGKGEIEIKTEVAKQNEAIKGNIEMRIKKWLEKKGKE